MFFNKLFLITFLLLIGVAYSKAQTKVYSKHFVSLSLGGGLTGYAGNLGFKPYNSNSLQYLGTISITYVPNKGIHGLFANYNFGLWGAYVDNFDQFLRGYQSGVIGYHYFFNKLKTLKTAKINPFARLGLGVVYFNSDGLIDVSGDAMFGSQFFLNDYIGFFGEINIKYFFSDANDFYFGKSSNLGDVLFSYSTGIVINILPPIKKSSKYNMESINCAENLKKRKRQKRFIFRY